MVRKLLRTCTSYQANATNVLRNGIEWRATGGGTPPWRWMLSGRQIHVLAPGAVFGFTSTTRLRLNERHAILASAEIRPQVMAALANADCTIEEVMGDNEGGVPTGWILFRNVTPQRAVLQRNAQDI